MEYFLRGLIIGFSIAAPVGPIGVLCIRRTIAFGRLSGFISGLGAASADAVYGSIAALGLTFLSDRLIANSDWLRLVGGLFLIYLGGKTFLDQSTSTEQFLSNNPVNQVGIVHLGSDYISTFFLTMTNPMTILSFMAVFAGLGLGGIDTSTGTGLALVFGVFWGSATWWLILNALAGEFRDRFLKPLGLRWVNRISGIVIILFGCLAFMSIIF